MKFKISILLWLRTCWRVVKFSGKRYAGDQLSQQAVVLTYYTLFAIVPLAALLFGIAKGFGLEHLLRNALYNRFQHQREILDYICEIAERTLQEASGGVVAGVGVIMLLWTVILLITSMEKSFNVVWGLPVRHKIWRKFSSYISLILLTPLLMVAVSTIGMMLRNHLNDCSENVSEMHFMHTLLANAADFAPVVAGSLFFFFVYWWVPNTRVRWQGSLLAGVITGVCFQVLQDSFLFLQSSVFAYNRLYGSFAVLPLFLIWINWSWQLILFGAEISFVHQHLRSGVFNEFKLKTDLRLRREHQLAILRLVFLRFENGEGAVDANEVSSTLRIPDVVLHSEIDELKDAGLLCCSGSHDGKEKESLLPGVPPDRFTIMDFFRVLNGNGDKEAEELACFEAVFNRIEEVVRNSGVNVKIHEI